MNDLERFEKYAADFEVAFENDDWSVVGRHFAKDAVYETLAGPPMGGRYEGRDAVLESMQNVVNGFDRRFDSREVTFIEGPEMRDGNVWLKARVVYVVAGAPDLVLEGVGTATFNEEGIIRLEDSYPDEAVSEVVVKYLTEYGDKLRPVPAGEPESAD